jgi:hypothetical protein
MAVNSDYEYVSRKGVKAQRTKPTGGNQKNWNADISTHGKRQPLTIERSYFFVFLPLRLRAFA